MLPVLEGASGALVMGVFLTDIFLTVLYARIGTGLIADRVAHLTWAIFCRAADVFGQKRGAVLSFCGPVILIVYVLLWALGLTLGAGLIIHPALGTSVRASTGETPTDFVTALYAGGSSMTIVGASDFKPSTDAYRGLYLVNSLVGMSATSLVLTYVMQVYSALRQRNALGLKLHLLAGETADAAELLARLGPQGQFSSGYTHLADIAGSMAEMKEAHHFYPVLFYFRFRQPFYSVSAQAFMALDAVSLIRSGIADRQAAWLKETAAVDAIWRVAMLLVVTLETTFLPGDLPVSAGVNSAESEVWRTRLAGAVRRLSAAGVETIPNEAGAETYLALRAQWQPHIARLAPMMAYHIDEFEPSGEKR
ncbi:two pore domain potassium channel family protein [Methylobacterium planeticum]|uniref:Two pore domain potassium channel family protein n=1 Tax=Methylobacterium planeticum TaxID=2615211 RepID=A0A6N6MP78_9HYPH|nr:two pore domain potassium channel family protein [Methylobacterium planeticum]KAB1071212.1 two pore domain potassium channel family protein [Methylobacterium planeticum]